MASPYINRFLQPDTLIPSPANPQSWNRYSYVYNRPVSFSDPTGHIGCDEDEHGRCVLSTLMANFKYPKFAKEDEMWCDGDTCYSPDELTLLFTYNLPPAYGVSNSALDAPGVASVIKLLWAEADEMTIEIFSEYDPDAVLHNSSSDAFHHAYWSALMTQQFGDDFAKDFTTAHETSYYASDDIEEVFMDLHNNQMGIEIGNLHPDATNDEIAGLVLEYLNAGKLYVWDGTDIYYSDEECSKCWHPQLK